MTIPSETMSSLLDTAGWATSVVLAYKLGTGVQHSAAPASPSILGGLVAALDLPGKARAVTQRLEAMTPTVAAVAPVAEQAPVAVAAPQAPATTNGLDAGKGAVAAPPTPQPAAEGTGLPDNLTPAEARRELLRELDAMTVDKIRVQARNLDSAKREILKRAVPNLEKARKQDLVAGMIKAFGL